MHASTLRSVLEHLRKLTGPARVRELSDADLLERFRLRREEAAFTLLVQRHGPMVLAVCRRVLGDLHEAEDAFQATFLVLVRNAAAIRKQESLAGWLHGVASRIAHKARMRSARQRARPLGTLPSIVRDDPSEKLAAAELRAALDEEIERLPDKYRMPLVLCYLADKTHEQAADELGWPKSSVTARLARARELLQRRLRQRGFTVPAGLLAALLTEQSANAAMPSLLTLSTVRLAMQALTGETLAATTAAVLADGFVKGAATAKYTAMLTLLATMGLAAALGTWMASSPVPSAPQKAPPQAIDNRREKPAQTPKPRVDLFGDPLPPGARARLGTVRLRHPGNISQYAFSPDGKILAAMGDSHISTVCLFDVATGRELRRLEPAGWKGVAFSPDGKILAAGAMRQVWRWDTATWKELPNWEVNVDRIEQLFFSPDGKTLACIGEKDRQPGVTTVALLDTSTGRDLCHRDGRGDYLGPSIAFAPDSKTWAYVDRHEKKIPLYDVSSGEEIRRFEGHSKAAHAVAFSLDGKTLASNDLDGTLRFWDTATGKLLPQQGKFYAVKLTYFPEGKRLLGSAGVPRLYDIATGKEIPTPKLPDSVLGCTPDHPVLLSPDGSRLVWGAYRALYLLDVKTFKPVLTDTSPPQEPWAVDFSSDGKVVAAATREDGEDGIVRRWDTTTGQPLSPFRGIRGRAITLAYSPDGKRLAVGANSGQREGGGTIWLLEAATGKRLRTFAAAKGGVFSLVFSADGRTLLSGQGQDTRLWDVATGKVLQTFPGGPILMSSGQPLALSPDTQVIAGTVEGRGRPTVIYLWQAADGKQVRTLQDPDNDTIHAVAFSLDGKTLASGGWRWSGAAVKLWDVATGRLLWQAKGHKGGVNFLSFSPDGKTLASGGLDGDVRLWEAATGKERWCFQKHRASVRRGAFSRDGKLLATGSDDTTILIWDLAAAAGPPRQSPLSAKELDALWADLSGDDATKAFQAIHRLAAVPQQTLPLLRQHLKPVPTADEKRIRQLVEMLDSADFPTRQKAAQELEKQDDSAIGLLRQITAKEKPSLEVRRRLQQIVESIESKPESLRAVRAVEVLEWMTTPDAGRFINELAAGAADARLTREAAAARTRLRR